LANTSDSVAKDKPMLNDLINETLSIGKFRRELIEIFLQISVSSYLFNTLTGWKSFLGVCLKRWLEKPLEFGKSTYPRYVSKFWLEIPDISSIDKDYITEFKIIPNSVFWSALILPGKYILKGPLVLTEPENSYS
jgi:hypothetical protein